MRNIDFSNQKQVDDYFLNLPYVRGKYSNVSVDSYSGFYTPANGSFFSNWIQPQEGVLYVSDWFVVNALPAGYVNPQLCQFNVFCPQVASDSFAGDFLISNFFVLDEDSFVTGWKYENDFRFLFSGFGFSLVSSSGYTPHSVYQGQPVTWYNTPYGFYDISGICYGYKLMFS